MYLLTVSLILLLANGMLWAQSSSVRLELEGDTIDLICESAGTYYIIGYNTDSVPGTFRLYEFDSEIPLEGHIIDDNLEDDTARLDPVGLAGRYTVNYLWVIGQQTTSIPIHFYVNILDDINILDLPDTVCKNDEPYPLVPEPALTDAAAIYTFAGNGVSGNQAEGYYYDPASAAVPVGPNEISLDYTSSYGCQTTAVYSIYNGFIPTPNFSSSPACIPTEGGEVYFNNLTSGKFSVETWSWDFGDPGSGSENYSSEENPDHFYSRPGPWKISLTAETYDGCFAGQTQDIQLSDEPLVDFTWISDCFKNGELTSFMDRTVSEFADIDNLIWTFKTSGGGVLGQIGSTSPDDTIDFPFTSINEYSVTLQVENELGCQGTETKIITLKPTYKLTADGYLETFDDSPADWLVDSENGTESWVSGEPDFTGFQAIPGDLAWYTDLSATQEGYTENSWVQSPCFDFSLLSLPMLKLDIMKSFVPGTDGSVAQYQEQVSAGWKTIGVVDGGINWYNSYGIFNEPGGSSFGWGLPLFEPDAQWVEAAYAMDTLAGSPHVKFRVAIGTGAAQAMGNQGFAFDNFVLGERVRKSVIEHFTNSASMDAKDADRVVKEFVTEHSGLVMDLHYHMDYPGEDPMNENNPQPPSARAFNYGVPVVPYAVMNGGATPELRYDFTDLSEQPGGELLLASSLVVPAFDVNLAADFLETAVEGTVKITCKEDGFDSNIQLYVVILEKKVTAYTGANGSTSFRNVVLDIFPSSSGKLLGNDWGAGISSDLDILWDYAPYVEDVEDLMLVAFIMDRDHDQILQSAFVEHTPSVGVEQLAPVGEFLAIYPNPSREFVYINFGKAVKQAGRIALVDLSGRSVFSSEVLPGHSIQKLDIAGLSDGIYIVQWIESGLLKGRAKLVHTH